jgi:hypothetical protein
VPPSGWTPPNGLRANQPGAQGIDTTDGLSRSFLVRVVLPKGNERLAGDLSESSQIPRAGSTAERADAAHLLGLLVKQKTGVSKVHFSGLPRCLTIH